MAQGWDFASAAAVSVHIVVCCAALGFLLASEIGMVLRILRGRRNIYAHYTARPDRRVAGKVLGLDHTQRKWAVVASALALITSAYVAFLSLATLFDWQYSLATLLLLYPSLVGVVSAALWLLTSWLLGRRQASARAEREFLYTLERKLRHLPAGAGKWKKVAVYHDSHVQYKFACYSVPSALIGEQLWLRATATTIMLFHEQDMVASHQRLGSSGQRNTVRAHLPARAAAFDTAPVQACMDSARQVGPHCFTVLVEMLDEHPFERLREVEAILQFRKKYGAAELERACAQASNFSKPSYKVVNFNFEGVRGCTSLKARLRTTWSLRIAAPLLQLVGKKARTPWELTVQTMHTLMFREGNTTVIATRLR